jgi:hypothetical protein
MIPSGGARRKQRQDAMTTKHGMRIALRVGLLALLLALPGCFTAGDEDGLVAPYEGRHVWAVAPLKNESGTRAADGLALADTLAQRLETVEGLEVLPVNRVLKAMDGLGMRRLDTREQAMELLGAIRADGLVVGTITAYEPYEPPKLGLALDLYTSLALHRAPLDVRELTKAATDPTAEPASDPPTQPVVSVSALYDANEPAVRERLSAYAQRRSKEERVGAERLYRISIDRYSEFVSHAIVDRLLEAERARLERVKQAKAKAEAKSDAKRSAEQPNATP